MNRTLAYIQALSRNLEHGIDWEEACAEHDDGVGTTTAEGREEAIHHIKLYVAAMMDGIEEANQMLLDINMMSQKKFNLKYNT